VTMTSPDQGTRPAQMRDPVAAKDNLGVLMGPRGVSQRRQDQVQVRPVQPGDDIHDVDRCLLEQGRDHGQEPTLPTGQRTGAVAQGVDVDPDPPARLGDDHRHEGRANRPSNARSSSSTPAVIGREPRAQARHRRPVCSNSNASITTSPIADGTDLATGPSFEARHIQFAVPIQRP
jgi:hypothetical protein